VLKAWGGNTKVDRGSSGGRKKNLGGGWYVLRSLYLYAKRLQFRRKLYRRKPKKTNG